MDCGSSLRVDRDCKGLDRTLFLGAGVLKKDLSIEQGLLEKGALVPGKPVVFDNRRSGRRFWSRRRGESSGFPQLGMIGNGVEILTEFRKKMRFGRLQRKKVSAWFFLYKRFFSQRIEHFERAS